MVVIISLVVFGFLKACYADAAINKKFVYTQDGRLYFPDGNELALWGVNLQPCLSWEYNSLFKLIGVPLDTNILKQATFESLDEIQAMNCNMVRCHLVPSDFTDDQGNLVETVYLDQLDYMVAESARRGMYVYLTFLNPKMSYDIDVDDPSEHTPLHVANSFVKDFDKQELLLNRELIAKSKNYIQGLLSRENPYLGTSYKDTPAIAVWEIVNEPVYYTYQQFKETEHCDDYLNWVKTRQRQENEEGYFAYRHYKVLDYINNMYDAVRQTGSVQPVVWNCNWHRMIRGKNDVFDAISKSKVEVVSFCNYPGQSVCKKPYTKNPVDLSRYDFSSFLKDSYVQEDWYRWALRPNFMKKAKVVYEFEIFYNQSSYLYPAQAAFFRAMGVQMASMWHYSMTTYAPYRNGSHHLSLTSTPGKAASYAVAGEVFRSLPLYHAYDTKTTTEKVAEHYMFSYRKDLSIFSSMERYCHSGDVSAGELPNPMEGVKKVLGYKSSPLADYQGTGIYTMDISEDTVTLNIKPNTIQLKELWGKDFLKSLVTKLDYTTPHAFRLNLAGWNAQNCVLYRVENNKKKKIEWHGNTLSFNASPGEYHVVKVMQ